MRLDSRGHGKSQVPPPEVPHSKERLSQDVLELLDTVGVDKVHILGGSAGGYTAQLLAIHHPQRVKSLVLFSSTPGFKGDQGKRWLREAAERGMRPVFGETIDERIPVSGSRSAADRMGPGRDLQERPQISRALHRHLDRYRFHGPGLTRSAARR